jgi:hypothetical protein
MKIPSLPTVLWRAGGVALVRDPKSWGVKLVKDPQGAATGFPGGVQFHSHLGAQHFRGGRLIGRHDLGSGLVTNAGVLALANDFAWSASLNLSTLGLANNHAWGTGATAAAATDIALQTLAAPTTTTAVAGVQSLISAANLQKYQTVATITAGGSLAITEWGLHSFLTLTASTGTPFTATSASSWTDTGSAQTASSPTVRGLQQLIVRPGTTTVWGLNLSNTTHVGTIVTNGWYKVADGTAGSTPGATEAFTIIPVMFDHKVFAAINVVLNDSIAFTYQLTVTSGG